VKIFHETDFYGILIYNNMKKHIITFAGSVGSGKSTSGKIIAQKLGYRHYSNGDFMRDLAKKRGETFIEFNKVLETTSPESIELNKLIDTSPLNFVGDGEDVVIDGHIGFNFFPQSFKVYLDLSPEVAAKRIFSQRRPDEPVLSDQEMFEKVLWRNQSVQDRFKKIYNVNIRDLSHYDLVIDTGAPEFNNNIDAVVSKVIEKYKEWLVE